VHGLGGLQLWNCKGSCRNLACGLGLDSWKFSPNLKTSYPKEWSRDGGGWSHSLWGERQGIDQSVPIPWASLNALGSCLFPKPPVHSVSSDFLLTNILVKIVKIHF